MSDESMMISGPIANACGSGPAIAVLLVCHNRRETTLRALRALALAGRDATLIPVLFDDASNDGTVTAVLAEFPRTKIVEGDGTAFWNRGLHIAWTHARNLPVDAFLWLNDDVELDRDAIARLLDAWRRVSAATSGHRFILVGATRGTDGVVTYSGQRLIPSPFALRFRAVQPNDDSLATVDTFNGNIVLVPRAVIAEIGLNDPAFHHNLGDIDYGLRATKAGIAVRLLPGTLGLCERNAAKALRGFGSPHLSLFEQWRKVNSHHGLPFFNWWRLTRRHSGAWFLLHFCLPYRRLVLPNFRKLMGSSEAQRRQ